MSSQSFLFVSFHPKLVVVGRFKPLERISRPKHGAHHIRQRRGRVLVQRDQSRTDMLQATLLGHSRRAIRHEQNKNRDADQRWLVLDGEHGIPCEGGLLVKGGAVVRDDMVGRADDHDDGAAGVEEVGVGLRHAVIESVGNVAHLVLDGQRSPEWFEGVHVLC